MRRVLLALAVVLAFAGALWLYVSSNDSADGPALPSSTSAKHTSSTSGGGPLLPAVQDTTPRALEGRVLDDAGKPVADAEISIATSKADSLAVEACTCGDCGETVLTCGCHHAGQQVASLLARREGEVVPERTTHSDAGGRFRFPDLAPGRYSLWAVAPGYATALRRNAEPGAGAELVLSRGLALTGAVEDERHAPVPNASVTAIPATIPHFVEASAAANGSFTLPSLAQEPHFLSVSAPGFLPAGLPGQLPGGATVRVTLSRPRTLTGLVRDGGKPAVGAEIHLLADHFSQTLVTGEDGRFRVEGLYPDGYSVTAVRKGRAAHAEVQVRAPTANVELDLQDALTVTGSVQDDAGTALEGALVVASNHGQRLAETHSDRSGAFTLPGIQAGARITATKEGFEPDSRRVEKDSEPVRLVLSHQIIVSGVVLTGDGTPAPGVQVVPQFGGRDRATSDGDGQFRLAVSAAGPVTLLAHHSSWGAGEVSVEAPASGVELRLDAKGGLRAVVKDAAGNPVAGARISAHDEGARGPASEIYGSDVPSTTRGEAVLAGLPAATYEVTFTAQGHPPLTKTGVQVPAKGLVDLGDVVLVDGLSIEGTVVHGDGTPAPGIWVHATSQGARTPSQGVASDAQGAFALTGLTAGSYRVTAFADTSVAEASTAAGTKGLELKLPAPTKVRGRVLSASGEPLRRFFIDSNPVDSADGRFETEVRSYRGTAFFRVGAPDHVSSFEHVTIAEGVGDAGDIVLEKAAALEGRVTNERGEPVAGASVTASPEGPQYEHGSPDDQTVTSSDGRFRLERLGAGALVLRARRGQLTGEAHAMVPASGSVEIRVQAKAAIEGTVRAGGSPLPFPVMLSAGGSSAVSDAQGRFRLDNLVPGQQRVEMLVMGASGPEHMAHLARDLQITSGDTMPLNVDLGGSLAIEIPGGERGEVELSGSTPDGWSFGTVVLSPGAHVDVSALLPGHYRVAYFGDPQPGGVRRAELDVRPGPNTVVLQKPVQVANP